jgi:hypothetical protein
MLMTVKCAVVRLRALMAQQSARLITNRPIKLFVQKALHSFDKEN